METKTRLRHMVVLGARNPRNTSIEGREELFLWCKPNVSLIGSLQIERTTDWDKVTCPDCLATMPGSGGKRFEYIRANHVFQLKYLFPEGTSLETLEGSEMNFQALRDSPTTVLIRLSRNLEPKISYYICYENQHWKPNQAIEELPAPQIIRAHNDYEAIEKYEAELRHNRQL